DLRGAVAVELAGGGQELCPGRGGRFLRALLHLHEERVRVGLRDQSNDDLGVSGRCRRRARVRGARAGCCERHDYRGGREHERRDQRSPPTWGWVRHLSPPAASARRLDNVVRRLITLRVPLVQIVPNCEKMRADRNAQSIRITHTCRMTTLT